jgi:hypothetical protein
MWLYILVLSINGRDLAYPNPSTTDSRVNVPGRNDDPERLRWQWVIELYILPEQFIHDVMWARSEHPQLTRNSPRLRHFTHFLEHVEREIEILTNDDRTQCVLLEADLGSR